MGRDALSLFWRKSGHVMSRHAYQRWTQGETVLSDRRPGAQRPVPTNKLSDEEREAILFQRSVPS